ncbi:hypothetical protein PENTCL1PPCAC_3882, partial [Pristionchus entomophagus]
LGHTRGFNVSGVVAFEFGTKVKSSRIEGAKLVFYLRAAQDPSARFAHLRVRDEMGAVIASDILTVLNAPTKMYSVPLDHDVLQRVIQSHARNNIIFLEVSVKGAASHDELLLLPGRQGHRLHMGVLLELKFASSKLASRRRRSVFTTGQKTHRGCDDDETTCCPHVQSFSWEQLGFSHIIAPLRFHSVVCRGSCEDFQHTGFKHTYNRQMVNTGMKKQCCHPVQYESQAIIWSDDDGNVVVRTIDNFYSTRCSCD